jgi:predicted alternative tryptophan synthase beta-subunit
VTPEEIVEVLAEVGKNVALATNATHPEDLGLAMSAAIEAGAQTLDVVITKKKAKEKKK